MTDNLPKPSAGIGAPPAGSGSVSFHASIDASTASAVIGTTMKILPRHDLPQVTAGVLATRPR